MRAPNCVAIFPTTVYRSAESWCMTVTNPSRQVANIRPRLGSKPAPSGSPAIEGVATTLPVSAFTTVNVLSQATKRRRFRLSYARADGPLHGARGQDPLRTRDRASNSTIEFLSSRFTKTLPCPSSAASSGFPPRGTVPTIVPVEPSIAVALALLPLKVKTRLVCRS